MKKNLVTVDTNGLKCDEHYYRNPAAGSGLQWTVPVFTGHIGMLLLLVVLNAELKFYFLNLVNYRKIESK